MYLRIHSEQARIKFFLSNNSYNLAENFLSAIRREGEVEVIVLGNLECVLKKLPLGLCLPTVIRWNLDDDRSHVWNDPLLNLIWCRRPIISAPEQIDVRVYVAVVVGRRSDLQQFSKNNAYGTMYELVHISSNFQ